MSDYLVIIERAEDAQPRGLFATGVQFLSARNHEAGRPTSRLLTGNRNCIGLDPHCCIPA